MNLDHCIEKLLSGKLLDEKQVKQLCDMCIKYFFELPNVTHVNAPVIVCGDIHGQFYDLKSIFEICGNPSPSTTYLFLGDYVDRGNHSVEVISLLLCLKLKYPRNIHLLRGNHECSSITKIYGFYAECDKKYCGNAMIWKSFVSVFPYLPLVAIIDNKIFCVHAGLSPEVNNLDEISVLNRLEENPEMGPVCDFLWSDPEDINGWQLIPKGYSFCFGSDVTEKFLHMNQLTYIARSHQLTMEGYNWVHNHACVTIFSAPNYAYRCNNTASVLKLDDHLNGTFVQFEANLEDKYHNIVESEDSTQ